MNFFSFSIPTEVVFGIDSVLMMGDYIKKHGNKVIIITEQKFYETHYISKIEKILKSFLIDYLIYDEITSDSGSEDLNNINILTRTSRAEVVIGMGGQRVLNIAKLVSLFAYNEKSFYYYIKNKEELKEKIPVILIPTTPRDYFALSDSCYYKDQDIGHIRLFSDRKLYADYIFIDPTFSVDISKKIMSAMLIEMISFSIDSIISKKSTIFTDTLLFKSIETINKNFKSGIEYPEDLEIKKELSLSGLFLMIAGRIAGFSLLQALSLAVASILKIPKLMASIILSPHIVEFNVSFHSDKLTKVANCLNLKTEGLSPLESSLLVSEYLQKIISDNDLPSRLSYYNVQKEIIGKIVDEAFEFDILFNSSKMFSKQDIFNIIYASL
ncbi:MAG: iron-containing alcohol dehydrogenase [Spirochaetes bacterium]|nr:iron-containing alcohol dehydrogenase [Spirochaetota bacterium]